MRGLLIPIAILALLPGCRKEGEVNVEILAHESVKNLSIGNREIDLDSRTTKYLGVDLPLGNHEVAWETGGRRMTGKISVESNSDNYLLLLEKAPWLKVDGGVKVLEPAKETF